jgi:catechol 2,3-dioxygenase-like lactoylglutathione lyase family enzyme
MAARVHHSAICAQDFQASLRFYRDGLGLEVMMDMEFDGDWPGLFDGPSSRLHSVFLGDPANLDAGIVELVAFTGAELSAAKRETGPRNGFFLLSFFVGDTDATLARLADIGLGGEPRRIELPGPDDSVVVMATVRDPDGVLVELIGR